MSSPTGESYPREKPYPKEGSMGPGIKQDPYIKCQDACDKINNEILQLFCRIACIFAK